MRKIGQGWYITALTFLPSALNRCVRTADFRSNSCLESLRRDDRARKMNTDTTAELHPDPPATIYNRTFWTCYVSNVLLVTANALTFRFAEFVAFLGGDEGTAGTIVGAGMLAAVICRFGIGQAIDHYGTRLLWRSSSVCLAISSLLFLAPDQLSWTIYPVRILFAVSMACMFSCSIVYVQGIVPAHRRTEVIASLGSSGFVGMIIGPLLGDLVFTTLPSGWPQFSALFGTAAALSTAYFVIVYRLTQNDRHSQPAQSIAAHRLLIQYWPGQILLIAVVLGAALTIPTVFLTRYATHLGLAGIGTFFLAYAGCAFTCRVLAARWMELIGLRRVILIGMAALGSGQLLLLLVSKEWHFLLPAAVCGVGHALLFPVVVSVGSGCFPLANRGTGTTLILGFTEVGIFIAAPVLGMIIDEFGFATMFTATGIMTLAFGAVYFLSTEPEGEVVADEQNAAAPYSAGEEPLAAPATAAKTPCGEPVTSVCRSA
ncbi:major facilitator superfamily transporter [Symmachiella dynata]|nr:major facilitator superfamily transporter [Symmachiella dynata]